MGYYETTPPELLDFPKLTQEELDWVDGRFQKYMMYETRGKKRKAWFSCCHRAETLDIKRVETPALRTARAAGHNDIIECPFCGEAVKVKCIGRCREGKTLTEYIPVVFLRASESGKTVWAQAYWTMRNPVNDPLGVTLFAWTSVYRFRRGEARQWQNYGEPREKEKKEWITEPFRSSGLYSGLEPYAVHGWDELEKSFLKYTPYEEPWGAWEQFENQGEDQGKERMTLMRFLGLAARYPEQVEMLSKMNLEEFIEDWVMAKRKNAAILKWGEKDPRKAFGLSRAELKTWVEHGGELDVLRLKKKHQEASVEECAAIRRAITMGKAEEFLGWARAFGIKAGKVIRYLERLPGPLSRNAITWLDWISMAEQLGYDLGNPLIQMPGELYRKHDEADSALRALKIRRMEQQERDRMERAEKKYGFTYGDYLIRAPINGEEIIEEGKALHHCVGGYAARHMDDVLTILFLRRKSAPYTPYVTIEMRGNSMMQIHGYNNERDGSESPAVVHREMLSAWGEWLKKGSKRDKDGNPILTKKKGNAA